jgi:polyvinyl alcohol dehydrogenase (cytochrome)
VDWPTYLGSNARTGYNGSETTLTAANFGTLPTTPKWTVHTGGPVSTQAVVANNLVYWGSWDGWMHARTFAGVDKWDMFLGHENPPCIAYVSPPGIVSTPTVVTTTVKQNGSNVNKSVMFVGGPDGRVYALDALTGTKIWSSPVLGGSSPPNYLWSSLAYFNGSLFIGIASYGDCPIVQGKFVKLDALTGQSVQSFSVVTACAEAGIWSSPAVDESTGMVYIPTGGYNGSCGMQPYTSSILEFRASDFTLQHHWQVPNNLNVFDGDFGTTPILFDYTINGTPRHLLGVVAKSGNYFVLDRDTLTLVWVTKIAVAGDDPPSNFGSISPSSFDGTTLYVAGGKTTINGTSCIGSVSALNPATGAFKWRHCLNSAAVLGAVTGIPGVIIVGQGTDINVINAVSGQTIWFFRDPQGGRVYAGATVTNGMMFTSNNNGNFYAWGF